MDDNINLIFEDVKHYLKGEGQFLCYLKEAVLRRII